MHNIKILLFCWKLPSIPPPRGWSRDLLWFCCSLWLSWLPTSDVLLNLSPQKRLTFSASFIRTSPGNLRSRHTPRGSQRPTPGSWEPWSKTSTWVQQAIEISAGLCGAWHTANNRWVVHKSLHNPVWRLARTIWGEWISCHSTLSGLCFSKKFGSDIFSMDL